MPRDSLDTLVQHLDGTNPWLNQPAPRVGSTLQFPVAQGLDKTGSPLSNVSLLISLPETDLKDWLSQPSERAEGLEDSTGTDPHLAGSAVVAGLHPAAGLPQRNAPAGMGLRKELSSATPACRDSVWTQAAPFSPLQSTGVPRQGGPCRKALCPTAAFWHLSFSAARNLCFWGPLRTKTRGSWELQGQLLTRQPPFSEPCPCFSALIQVFKAKHHFSVWYVLFCRRCDPPVIAHFPLPSP